MDTAYELQLEVLALRKQLAAITEIRQQELRLLETSLAMLCTISVDTGHFVRLSPIWSQALGYTDDELRAQPLLELVHPIDRAQTVAAARELSGKMNVVPFTNRCRSKRGDYRWLDWVYTFSPAQRLIYAVARDVTEHKETETELSRSELRTAELLRQCQEYKAQLQRQSAVLQELAPPVIVLAAEIIVMPVIGHIDPVRSRQLIESLFDGVAQYKALIALIDLSGVQVLDSYGAEALNYAAQTVKLLGCMTVLTGVLPAMQQTLANSNVDLGSLLTYTTLQEGIDFAFRWIPEASTRWQSPRSHGTSAAPTAIHLRPFGSSGPSRR